MGDGKENAEQLTISNFRRIVNYFDRLSVASGFGCDLSIGRSRFRATRISSRGFNYTLQTLKNDCVPQKQPPAKTAVCLPDDVASATSVVGAGIGVFGIAEAWHATKKTVNMKLKNERERLADMESPLTR